MKKPVYLLFTLLFFIVQPLPGTVASKEISENAGNSSLFDSTGDEDPIRSMGQPSKYEFYLGPMLINDREDDDWGGVALGGVNRHLLNPNFGIGIAGEGYLGAVGGETDSGFRLLGVFDFLFLKGGLDHSFRHDETDFILSFALPLKRGGLFGRGGSLRVDWIPGRDNSFGVGLTIPLWQPYKGKTRTKHDRVTLPQSWDDMVDFKRVIIPDGMETIFEQIDHAANWINRFTTPFFDQELSRDEDELSEFRAKVQSFKEHLNLSDGDHPEGHTVYSEAVSYHRAVEQAFRAALRGGGLNDRGEEARRITDEARNLLFRTVIVPYNRLLGQNKKNDSLKGYGRQAQDRFEAWLMKEIDLSEDQREASLYVFQRLINIMDKNREGSKTVWKDSKLVWIPLHYGLRPLEYNSQERMDRVLEMLTNDEFVDGNDIYYVINEQFQAEVARMILEAKDYHVLWIHDYRGKTPAGNPDRIGHAMTVIGYLAAMTRRVQEYDRTGKLPVYFIVMDQFYYEANEGRLWLDILENPMEKEISLTDGFGAWEKEIKDGQEDLRRAVMGSSRLQEESGRLGRDWLSNRIKVHVNITNQSDLSFRSAALIDNFPIAPDNLMRDHRKISFYDVTERDPGKGEAIYSGLGIGEHYAGPTWEDRSILVTGPVLVSLKDAVRKVLLQQGFKESEIPKPLRKFPKPENYGDMVRALGEKGWHARLMDIHNETGFRPKAINGLKATLYSLMPPGSTIIVPDSLWNSPFWGGMLAGAALRGCRVLIIAPALENAPSAGFPQMSRAYELFSRLIIVEKMLREQIIAAGGMLKVGKYAPVSDVGDIRGSISEFQAGVEKHPFLKEVFPFGQDVYDILNTFDAELTAKGFKPRYFTEDIKDRKPKLHLKVNFFSSREMRELLTWDGWDELMLYHGRYMASLQEREEGYVDVKDVPEELEEAANKLLNSYWFTLSPEEQKRVIYYLTVGSQNQDYRGTIMDGEAAAVVSGYHSLVGLIDLFYVSGLTTWVNDIDDLKELLPPESGWRRWLGRYIMKAL